MIISKVQLFNFKSFIGSANGKTHDKHKLPDFAAKTVYRPNFVYTNEWTKNSQTSVNGITKFAR